MSDRYDELRAALDAMKATNSMVEATYWMAVIMRESEALLSERDSLLAAKEADGRQKRAYLDEIDRLKLKVSEQRGVLEWIANHRNTHLTDGSAATRACLDEIVNLAAAALTTKEGYDMTDQYDDFEAVLTALSEANERASILQTALHERTAERDEARKALASPPPLKGEALPVAWATKEMILGLSKPRVSECTTKLTRDAQPEYGFTQPLYARPSPGVSRETIEKLIAWSQDDHKRGCQGREYACTCGHDERGEGLLALLSQDPTPPHIEGET